MSRYFPHTPYAEDQPLAHTILTTHVLTRAVTTGAVLGTGVFGLQTALARVRGRRQPPPVSSSSPAPAVPRYLATTGRTTLYTLGLVSLGLAGRMWGRADIEWRDRAWRLLESRGQLETDDWTYAGMLLGGGGGAAVVAARGAVAGTPVAALGAVAAGSLVGTLGYLGWRYGVNGGRFPESENER